MVAGYARLCGGTSSPGRAGQGEREVVGWQPPVAIASIAEIVRNSAQPRRVAGLPAARSVFEAFETQVYSNSPKKKRREAHARA